MSFGSRLKNVFQIISLLIVSLFAHADWQSSNGTMTDNMTISEACSDKLVPIIEMRNRCQEVVHVNFVKSYYESKQGIETLREIRITTPGATCELMIVKSLGDRGYVNTPKINPNLPVGEIIGSQEPRWEFSATLETLKKCQIANRAKILGAKSSDSNVIVLTHENMDQMKPLIPADLFYAMFTPYASSTGGLIIYSGNDKSEIIGFVAGLNSRWTRFTRWGVRVLTDEELKP